jgi:hypothetical protein
VYSSIPGRAISKSRPTLALEPVWGLELPELLALLEPAAEVIGEEPDNVGMIESVDAPSKAAGNDNAVSMVGKTLRFSRADSFCKPNRIPEYFPSSLRFGAMIV